MSEFNMFFRIHDKSRAELEALLLELFPQYSLAKKQTENIILHPSSSLLKKLKSQDKGYKAPKEAYYLNFYLEDEHPSTISFSTWLMNEEIDLSTEMQKRKWTYLTYGYHTGAGWDELQVYQSGKLRYTEDIAGEFIQFNKKEYELEFGKGTGQEQALTLLAKKLGNAKVILLDWKQCINDGVSLSSNCPD